MRSKKESALQPRSVERTQPTAQAVGALSKTWQALEGRKKSTDHPHGHLVHPPTRATHGQSDLLLTPHSDRARYEKYREAWDLLRR